MGADFVWMRQEFPWLGTGFIHAVHASALPAFRRRLRDLRFEFYETIGSPDRTVFDQLAGAFMFPEYYGGEWDAFNDWIGDVEPPPRSVLLWHDADLFAASEAKRFGECCAIVSGVFDS
ncbi:MAG: barstar family protein [Nocardioidaceae bacterium]